MEKQVVLREIENTDNIQVAQLIRAVLEEYGVPKVGSAYEDKALEDMFTAYSTPRSIFFVVADGKKIIGCAGIAPLDNYDGNVCELQKMYLTKETRGLGLGKKLIVQCLAKAKGFGFDGCYLETMPYMEVAQNLYVKNGFTHIEAPMGCTGHTACPVYMYKAL
ncbi:MAG: GNAT family N-acetyltransferase [Bacteroidota bacterium]